MSLNKVMRLAVVASVVFGFHLLFQQPVWGQVSSARADVTPYYDDAAVARQDYRNSPYYLELADGWQTQATDSSILYTRQVEAERNWKDYLVFVNVRAGRGVRVLVNGKEMGCADDSRHWNEFLISPGLKYDRNNTLTIEAMKQSRGALLEDAALRVGLDGNPYLLFKSDPNVADYTLVADYDAASGTGTLTLSANVFCGRKRGKYYLETEVWDPKGHEFDRMGRWVVFNGKDEETVDISRSWAGVSPWNAESPMLYTLIVRLRNEKMEEEETVGTRFGFRRVEVKDGVLRINDRAVTLRGVTYGMARTETSREQMRSDVENMKRNNINAVRTARCSPVSPFFYELCDLYGLYVVCDANLMPLSEQHHAVATDQDFIPLFEHRVENLYGKYKNHTSIIAWSLGNTRDNGVCMTAAFKYLKGKEKTRPVVFAGADYGETTDIIAPVRPNAGELRKALQKQGARPYIMLVSAGADNFPDLQPLWRLVEDNRQLQGGFVDLWPVNATMLSELKHLYRPFDVKLSKLTTDEGEFVVYNRNDFSNFGRYTLEYNIFTNLRPSITGGDLPVAIPAGGSDKVSMRIPPLDLQAGEEAFIRFTLVDRRATHGRTVGVVEMPLAVSERPRQAAEPPLATTVTHRSTLVPRLIFLNHDNWTYTCVDSLERSPEEGVICVDRILRYQAPDGSVMCDVSATCTYFASGDITVRYTLVPSYRLHGVALRPAVLVGHCCDSVTWFGLDKEVVFLTDHSGLVGTYTAPTPLVRRQVRWCALHGAGENLFVETGMSSFAAYKDRLIVAPQESGDSFEVHFRWYGEENPAYMGDKSLPFYPSTLQMPPPPASMATKIEKVTFSRKASTPYNVGTDTILIDGEKGEVDELSRGWLGFAAEPPVITLQLDNPHTLRHIVLRCAHAPATWAFAPQQVTAVFSADGIGYSDTVVVELPFDPADESEATPRVEDILIPAPNREAQYIRIVPSTLATIPAWHRAKGLKPWLLMDEIEVIETK